MLDLSWDLLNRCRIMLTPLHLGMRDTSFGKIYHNFQNFTYKYMASSEAMTSSTHSFAHSYRHFHKCCVKISKTSKCQTSLFFNRFSSSFQCFVQKKLFLSSESKSNLFRIWFHLKRKKSELHGPLCYNLCVFEKV